MKQLLIRADADSGMGMGHMMRMLALAQAWIDEGGKVTICFVTCPDNMLSRFRTESIDFEALQVNEIGSISDCEETLNVAERVRADWIVLDGYRFTYEFQKAIKASGKSLLILDDCHSHQNWCADFILNQNLGISNEDYAHVAPSVKLLLGCKYALLRREFRDVLHLTEPIDRNSGKRILITFGGSDPDNITTQFLDGLTNIDADKLELRILVGAANCHKQVIQKWILQHSIHVEIMEDVVDMSAQYLWADAIVTAVGGSTWEWLLFRKTAGIIPIVDNQNKLACELDERSLATILGFVEDGSLTLDPKKLNKWFRSIQDESVLTTDGYHLKELDGRGVLRVCQEMINSGFKKIQV